MRCMTNKAGSGKPVVCVQARSCMAIPRSPRSAWLCRVHPLTRLSDVVGDCARAHTLQRSPAAMHPSVFFSSLRAQWRAAGRMLSGSESDDSPASPAGWVRWRLCQRGPAHQRCDHVLTIVYSDTCVYIQIHTNTGYMCITYRCIQSLYIHIHTDMQSYLSCPGRRPCYSTLIPATVSS